MTRRHTVLLWPALHVLLMAGAAMAQYDQANGADTGEPWVFVNELGDVRQTATPTDDRIHSHGTISLDTADYFRGRFDGVRQRCDDLSWRISPAWTIEFPENSLAETWSVTAGINSAFSDTDPFDDVTSPEVWYEADLYVGAAFKLQGDFLLGVTYTAFTAPNSIFETDQELAAALGYVGDDRLGRLAPQGKLAVNLEGAGAFLGAGINPRIGPWDDLPLVLGVPVEVGLGLDDYYGDDSDARLFGSVGLTTAIPLRWVPEDYGRWSVTAGVFVIIRETGIADVYENVDDAGNCVVLGSIGLAWAQ